MEKRPASFVSLFPALSAALKKLSGACAIGGKESPFHVDLPQAIRPTPERARRSQRVLMQVSVRLARNRHLRGKPFGRRGDTMAIPNAHGALVLLQARAPAALLRCETTPPGKSRRAGISVVFLGPVRGNKAETAGRRGRGAKKNQKFPRAVNTVWVSRLLPRTGRQKIRSRGPPPSNPASTK